MRFSIVTPTLNAAPFIEATLRSVRRQGYEHFEHLTVDAGSEDGTFEIAQSFAATDERFRVVQRPGETQYESILFGFSEARGDWLGWLNGDDLYAPWALATLAEFLAANGSERWVTGLPGLWDDEGRLRFVRPQAGYPRTLIAKGWFHTDLLGTIQQESTFFARSLFRELTRDEAMDFATAEIAGDYKLWRMLASRQRLATVPTVLGGFRRHGANRSVRGLDAYRREVNAYGAVNLPLPLTVLAQFAWRTASAAHAAKLAQREDARQGGAAGG